MRAIVLAAGMGNRLVPLTQSKPKPLVEVFGRPLISYALAELSRAGIIDIGIVVRYRATQIEEYVRENWGSSVAFFAQGESPGTAAALLAASSFATEDFLLIFGDALLERNSLVALAHSHHIHAIGISRSENPSRFGCVELDVCGMAIDIVEKPDHPTSNIIVAGGYRLTPSIIPYATAVRASPRGELELPDAIRSAMRAGVRFAAIEVPGCRDVATAQDISDIETHCDSARYFNT